MFNKSDYKILATLVEKECFSEIMSYNIKQISLETGLSVPKIRIVLKSFLLMELIKEGARDGISKTFYVTEKGRQFLNNALNPEYESNNDDDNNKEE